MSGLRDANGTIVIDEAEAEEDVLRIQQARSKLEEAKKYLDPRALDSSRMHGAAREALEEQLSKIAYDLSDWQDRCDSSVKYIRHVVAEYKRIDHEYAAKAKELK